MSENENSEAFELKNGKFSVYCIKNKISEQSYIGITTKPVEKRWYQHKWLAAQGISNSLIHKAIKEHGHENFEFQVIDSTDDIKELEQLEREYIKDLNTLCPDGYNMTDGGSFGRKVSNFKRPRKDGLELANGLTKELLKKISDHCRRNGVTHLKVDSYGLEIEFSPAALFPESAYKQKKLSETSGDLATEPSLTDEDVLFWSSEGIN